MKVPEKFKEYIWLLNIIYKYDGITFAKINEEWVKTELSGGVELAKSYFLPTQECHRIHIRCVYRVRPGLQVLHC